MRPEALIIRSGSPLAGVVGLHGAKNSVLVAMAATLLADGVSQLHNVPMSDDVLHMVALLQALGALVVIHPERHQVSIDTRSVNKYTVPADLMHKMRASVLVMGPLLARYACAEVALPGGCRLGARPIDFHLQALARMGAHISIEGSYVRAQAPNLRAAHVVLPYPSVGATENCIMAAVFAPGCTKIVNAAFEPEVFDLIHMLQEMGADITILPANTIEIRSVSQLRPANHTIMMDRLEAGTLLLAACITGGQVVLPDAPWQSMEVFLQLLDTMGHRVEYGTTAIPGVSLVATSRPRAVSFKTMPYPGFPTDLQAQTMAVLCLADGVSMIDETVFENRMLHVRELNNMGAQVVLQGSTATVTGVDQLYGAPVIASDIRAAAGLVIAGLAAQGTTVLTGTHHMYRGYESLVAQLQSMGAQIEAGVLQPAVRVREQVTL